MKIRIKTTGMLDEFLPLEKTGNRMVLETDVHATPEQVIRQLKMPASTYLVSVNGELVPASFHNTHRLKENDEMTIMPPLTGG